MSYEKSGKNFVEFKYAIMIFIMFLIQFTLYKTGIYYIILWQKGFAFWQYN